MELPIKKYVVPEIVFGRGALDLAGKYAMNFGARHILIVTDPGVIEAGWFTRLEKVIQQTGLEYTIYSEVQENPLADEVMQGADVYRANNCDVIIALGGGSPMDCAKGIGVVSTNQTDVLSFEGVDNVKVPGPPLICIPTTAGSAADISQFAIINNAAEKIKIAIISKSMVPDIALVDPAVTHTMDRHLTACTGMDSLVHAMEAYVSLAASPLTDMHALEAIRLIGQNLPKTIENLQNETARDYLMLASMQAGIAFSNASLGAVHAMSHSLGGFYNLAHGESNSLLLEHVVDFNFLSAPEKYCDIARALGKNDTLPQEEQKSALVDAIHELRYKVGITGSLTEKGVRGQDLLQLAEKAIHDPCMITNPVQMSLDNVREVYRRAM